MIRRHSVTAIAIHWFNAVCWIFLLLSGFALLSNPEMQPVGNWWANAWLALFGSEAALLRVHIIVGILWAAVFVIYLIFRTRAEAAPFLREITRLSVKSDIVWCLKKTLWLVTSTKTMRRLGVDPELPRQGFYNAGQKMVAVLAVLASITLVITGALMVWYSDKPGSENLLQYCVLIHFCAAGCMAIFLPVHIYMAACAPGEGPALRSMFTGYVPESFVKHHNPLWYEKLQREGALEGPHTRKE